MRPPADYSTFGGLFELMGVAGAGKSTVARALAESISDLADGTRWARQQYTFSMFLGTLGHFGSFPKGYRGSLQHRWNDARSLAHLDAFRRLVSCGPSTEGHPCVFDHGPLYRLARLRSWIRSLHPACQTALRYHAAVKYWATTLDLVVMLDAPDPVLIERVMQRPRYHRMKRMQESVAKRFVVECRGNLREVLDETEAHSSVRVLTLDTTQHTIPEVVRAIETQLHRQRRLARAA